MSVIQRRLLVGTTLTCAIAIFGSTVAYAAPTVADTTSGWSKVAGKLATKSKGQPLKTGAIAS